MEPHPAVQRSGGQGQTPCQCSEGPLSLCTFLPIASENRFHFSHPLSPLPSTHTAPLIHIPDSFPPPPPPSQAGYSPHPGNQTLRPSWSAALERAVTLLPDGDKPGYMGGEGLAQETLGMQKAEPHLNKELPALGIIVLLRENLAETGKDSEAVPGGGRTVVLRTVQLSHPLFPFLRGTPTLSPVLCPPTWLLPPKLPEACGWGWTAGLTQRRKLKRSFGAVGTPVEAQEENQGCGAPLHIIVPHRVIFSYLCHTDPLLQEPGPLGGPEWPYGHLPRPLSSWDGPQDRANHCPCHLVELCDSSSDRWAEVGMSWPVSVTP
jgi:hypothetical protein